MASSAIFGNSVSLAFEAFSNNYPTLALAFLCTASSPQSATDVGCARSLCSKAPFMAY